jgi:hypothetical protein
VRALTVAGLLIVALVVRVGVVVATPDFEPVNDAASYVEHAESISAGHGYPPSSIVPGGGQPSAYRPPASRTCSEVSTRSSATT